MRGKGGYGDSYHAGSYSPGAPDPSPAARRGKGDSARPYGARFAPTPALPALEPSSSRQLVVRGTRELTDCWNRGRGCLGRVSSSFVVCSACRSFSTALYVCGYCGWENLHDSCCTNGCFGSRADGRPLSNLDGVITSAILSALDAGQMSAYHRSRPGRPFRAAGTFSLRSCSFPGGTVAPDVLLGRDPVIDQGSICWMAANRPDALEA